MVPEAASIEVEGTFDFQGGFRRCATGAQNTQPEHTHISKLG